MSPLPESERRALLDLARRALTEAVLHRAILDYAKPEGLLAQPAGCFVTLHRQGRLRGCLGQIEASMPLAEAVVRCAVAVSSEDPRFVPVAADELDDVEIEISVLSPLAPVQPDQVVVGRHGLLVCQGPFRGLLLPQVATEHSWTRERFLEETCLKAGLTRESWKDPATRIEAFTAEVFSEAQLFPERHARAS